MVFTLIVRRLKPGTYEQFRKAWEPAVWPDHMIKNWLARHDDDPNIIMSITQLDIDEEGLDRLRDDPTWVNAEVKRLGLIGEFEDELITSGFFHVIEEHDAPPGATVAPPRES
jgi:hypothetical protein